MDFMSDQLATGRRFRILNIVDDYRVNALGRSSICRFRASVSADYWINWPKVEVYRKQPLSITVRSSPVRRCLCGHNAGVQLRFIQPGKPIQNAFVESFNGKLRDECLNEHWFLNLATRDGILKDGGFTTTEFSRTARWNISRQSSFIWRAEGCGKAGRNTALENSYAEKRFEFSAFPQPRRRGQFNEILTLESDLIPGEGQKRHRGAWLRRLFYNLST
jgi:hypothetical protein